MRFSEWRVLLQDDVMTGRPSSQRCGVYGVHSSYNALLLYQSILGILYDGKHVTSGQNCVYILIQVLFLTRTSLALRQG